MHAPVCGGRSEDNFEVELWSPDLLSSAVFTCWAVLMVLLFSLSCGGKEGGGRTHACMHMYTHHMCGHALRGQRRSWLYVTVSPLVWVLGMELGSWARAADTLSGKAIVFQALSLCVSVPKSCLAYCVLGQLWGMFLCRSKLPFSFPEPGASDNLAPLHPV